MLRPWWESEQGVADRLFGDLPGVVRPGLAVDWGAGTAKRIISMRSPVDRADPRERQNAIYRAYNGILPQPWDYQTSDRPHLLLQDGEKQDRDNGIAQRRRATYEDAMQQVRSAVRPAQRPMATIKGWATQGQTWEFQPGPNSFRGQPIRIDARPVAFRGMSTGRLPGYHITRAGWEKYSSGEWMPRPTQKIGDTLYSYEGRRNEIIDRARQFFGGNAMPQNNAMQPYAAQSNANQRAYAGGQKLISRRRAESIASEFAKKRGISLEEAWNALMEYAKSRGYRIEG